VLSNKKLSKADVMLYTMFGI